METHFSFTLLFIKKKKIFFKVEASDKLLSSIDEISKENRVLKQNPRFAILTDFKHLVAKDLKLGTNLDIEIKELPNYLDFFLPLAGSDVYNTKNHRQRMSCQHYAERKK